MWAVNLAKAVHLREIDLMLTSSSCLTYCAEKVHKEDGWTFSDVAGTHLVLSPPEDPYASSRGRSSAHPPRLGIFLGLLGADDLPNHHLRCVAGLLPPPASFRPRLLLQTTDCRAALGVAAFQVPSRYVPFFLRHPLQFPCHPRNLEEHLLWHPPSP